MKNKYIIAILLLIIIVLISVFAVLMFSPFDTTESSMISIKSNSSLYEGDNLSFSLTNLNKTPIENEFLDIVVSDSSGKVVMNESVKTNSKGNVKLALDISEGNYTVNVTFAGNSNYTGNSTSQKLTVKEKVDESKTVSNSQYSSSSSSSSKSSSDYYGPEVDSGGITREEAKKYGFKYTSKHGGHYIGSHDSWDEKAGVYHD